MASQNNELVGVEVGQLAPDLPKNEDLLKVLVELGKSSESQVSDAELTACQIRRRS